MKRVKVEDLPVIRDALVPGSGWRAEAGRLYACRLWHRGRDGSVWRIHEGRKRGHSLGPKRPFWWAEIRGPIPDDTEVDL